MKMVCCNSSRNTHNHVGSKDILSKLINRAEKRKSKAESFHIYALLQSTVERLRSDSRLLDHRKHKLKVCKIVNFNRSEDNSVKKDYFSEESPSENDQQNVMDGDPLKLDAFFSRLKR